VNSQEDQLSRAMQFFETFEKATNPTEKIRSFESGIDLLDACLKSPAGLSEDTRRRVQQLRTSYAVKLLRFLPDVRGGSTEPWLDCVRILLLKMKPEIDAVLRDYTRNAVLIPQPGEGTVVRISPPALTWLPLPGASDYRVEVYDHSGAVAYEKVVKNDPVHLPDRVFRPGAYTWDVFALDRGGRERGRRGRMSFTIPENIPELPWVEPRVLLARVPERHPRFLYPKSEISAIRATLETSGRKAFNACLRAAKHALKAQLPRYPAHHRIGDQPKARLACQRYAMKLAKCLNGALMDLSLAFLLTGEAAYAEAGKAILLEVADWPVVDNDVTSVSARWGDEPGLILARCGHRAYDWLYDALSDRERAKVLTMCEARAWQAYRRLFRCNYLACPGESHNGRLIVYLAEMAIVMAGESDGAETWFEYALKALTTLYPHWGGNEGGWAEGIAYGAPYNILYIPAFETIKKTTGYDLWSRPFFRHLGYFFLYCTALRGEISPFGDDAEKWGPGKGKNHHYASLLQYHAGRFNAPYLGWYADQVSDRRGHGGELSFLFNDSLKTEPPTDLPGSRVFHDVGWAAFHSNLSRPDEDTFFLFKSSPYGSVSHSHADQNAFCIMKGGRALAIPSGYTGPLAGFPHHERWTCSTEANNCILVNGEGQAIRERRASGRISAFETRQRLSYVAGDASAAYMGRVSRFDRHVLFLLPGLFLLLDVLETPKPALFQWMLHAFEKMKVDVDSGRVISRRHGATLDVRLRSPMGLTFSRTDRFRTPYNAGAPTAFHEKKLNQWHLTAETEQQADAARIGAVMAARGPGERLDLEILEKDGWLGARATSASGTAEGWVQLQPGRAGPAGYGHAVAAGNATICGMAETGEKYVI